MIARTNEIAEKTIIGKILGAETTASDLRDAGITENHFVHYRSLFEAVRTFAANGGGTEFDLVTHLHAEGRLEACGGAALITSARIETIGASLPQAIQALRRAYGERLIQSALPTLAQNPSDPEALERIAEGRRELECVAKGSNTKTLDSFRVNHEDTIDLSWHDIEALRPPFVVDHFGRRGELLLIAAESKSRKSWLVQDLAFSVALGLPWLRDENGNGGFETRRAKVHVCDLELDSSEMRFRLAKARANWTTDTAAAKAITTNMASYSLDGVQSLDVLAYLEQLRPTVAPGDLVVVDCLYRLQADGNETELVANVMQTLKEFAKSTQCLIALIDHFRKAGADKARDRIAGTFVKAASASTIVSIETDAEKVLQMSIDARTFHGCDRVRARFDLESYRFVQVTDDFATEETTTDCTRWIVKLWQSHAITEAVTVRSAMAKWPDVTTRQGATKRLERLEKMLWICSRSGGKGRSNEFFLTSLGVERIRHATESVAPVAGEAVKSQKSFEL